MQRPYALLTAAIAITTSAGASLRAPFQNPRSAQAEFDCGFISYEEMLEIAEEGQALGVFRDPPAVAEASSGSGASIPCLTPQQIFAFEDTNQVLLTNFSNCDLFVLMTAAGNAVMATHGDEFDFIGYFLNFQPDHQIGGAFYAGLENDVSGIGLTPFNFRPCIGLGGNNVEGFIMMWDVNVTWATGTGPNADFTRLALAQEFEHRYALFLPDLADGRSMQGDDGACGRSAHWNWQIDGQGSGMEISEWIGANPAFGNFFVNFNTDIPGGVFSYADLYLMGYVTPAEMDAGQSELRFVNDASCNSPTNASISTFTSADIITTAGPRVPDVTGEDKNYRTAWIMLHLPGDPPDAGELAKAVGILDQHQLDWAYSTLGRGTMNNTLFDDCNCNGVPDSTDIAGGSADLNGNLIPDECEALEFTYCTGKLNSDGCTPQVAFAGTPSLTAPTSFDITASLVRAQVTGLYFYSLNGPTAQPFMGGVLCAQPPLVRTPIQNSGGFGICGGVYTFDFNSWAQSGIHPALGVGTLVNGQYWYRDNLDPFGVGLTNAIEFYLGS